MRGEETWGGICPGFSVVERGPVEASPSAAQVRAIAEIVVEVREVGFVTENGALAQILGAVAEGH